MITKKAEQIGIDIDNKPFVAYKCSQQAYQEKYKEKQLSEPKTTFDYWKEIGEADLERKNLEHGE